jgi:hypothetical protein
MSPAGAKQKNGKSTVTLANSISGIDKRVARAFPSPSKKVAAIAKREAHMQARLGFSYFINEAGKRTKSDVLRKVLGSGPVAHQVKYELEKKQLIIGNATTAASSNVGEYGDEDVIFGKFEQSWFASIVRLTFDIGTPEIHRTQNGLI